MTFWDWLTRISRRGRRYQDGQYNAGLYGAFQPKRRYNVGQYGVGPYEL